MGFFREFLRRRMGNKRVKMEERRRQGKGTGQGNIEALSVKRRIAKGGSQASGMRAPRF